MHPKALGKEKQTTPKKSRWEEIFKIRDDKSNKKKHRENTNNQFYEKLSLFKKINKLLAKLKRKDQIL